MFKFTKRKIESNGVLLIQLWEGKDWCNVCALRPEDQTPEEIKLTMDSMLRSAKRENAPRNGKRITL